VFYRSLTGAVVTTVMIGTMRIAFATPHWKEHTERGLTAGSVKTRPRA
jgi:hypothetical protein